MEVCFYNFVVALISLQLPKQKEGLFFPLWFVKFDIKNNQKLPKIIT